LHFVSNFKNTIGGGAIELVYRNDMGPDKVHVGQS